MLVADQDQPWTVLRLLEWTTQFFRQRGSDSPRLDAEVLLAHVRGCDRIQLYTAFEDIPDPEQRTAFRNLVRRRGEGTPVAYLVGYREFYSLRLKVNENVLIPRPETEHVVIEALDAAKSLSVSGRPIRIADVGTGSGAIAIAIAKHLPGAEITATEIDPAAMQVAASNLEQHGVGESVRLVEGNLLEAIEPGLRFDILCSNPPYVSESEFAELEPGVREHEPRGSLVSGPTGMEVIEQLVSLAPERLEPGGYLIVELSPMIADPCLQLAESNPKLTGAHLVKDLDGNKRVLVARHDPDRPKQPAHPDRP